MPREFTEAEARWVKRLKRCFDDMPDTLCGFHSPGSIAFADREDNAVLSGIDGSLAGIDRQSVVIDSISSRALNRIGEGDW